MKDLMPNMGGSTNCRGNTVQLIPGQDGSDTVYDYNYEYQKAVR